MYVVPREQQFHHASYGVCGVSSGGFQRDDQSGPRVGGVPDRLHDVSYDDGMAVVNVQSQHDEVPPDGSAHNGDALHGMPHCLAVVIAIDGVCELSSDGLQQHDESGSLIGRVPDHLRDLPHDDLLGRCDVQSHVVPAIPRQFRRGVRNVSHERKRLFGLFLHQRGVPPTGHNGFSSHLCRRIFVQQHCLLQVPSTRKRRLTSDG